MQRKNSTSEKLNNFDKYEDLDDADYNPTLALRRRSSANSIEREFSIRQYLENQEVRNGR